MMKHLISLFLALLLGSVSWSQEAQEPGDEAVDSAEVSDAAGVSEAGTSEDEDDADLDDPGYENDEEDDFIPSEEVSADQSLAFPVDI